MILRYPVMMLSIVLSAALTGCFYQAEPAGPIGPTIVKQKSADMTVARAVVAEPVDDTVPQLEASPEEGGQRANAPQDAGESISVSFEKIKFKDQAGMHRFSLKPREDGAKLVDAEENELARYKLSSDKLEVRTPDDQKLAYIIFAEPHFHIEDEDQSTRLWKLQQQPDGDWKLEQFNDTLVYRVMQREYGHEVEDASDQSLFKAKLKSGKTSLRDSNDTTIYSTKDGFSSLAMACLGLEAIEDERIRFGLVVAVLIQQGT